MVQTIEHHRIRLRTQIPATARPAVSSGKPITAGSDGGSISSDGSLLALREGRRVSAWLNLAGCVDDPRAPERIQHNLAVILRFHLLMIAAGYEDGSDADKTLAMASNLTDKLGSMMW